MNISPKSIIAWVANNFIGLAAFFGTVAISFVLLIALAPERNPSLPNSRDIFTLYDTYNMTVVVVFDEESPTVQFIAPDGGPVDMENIRYRTGGNFVQYFLPNAMPGNWQMSYDPLSNTEISTHYSVYMEHIFIKSFVAGVPETLMIGNEYADGFNIPTSFEVSADQTCEFNYEIHAVFTAPDNSITDEVLLVKGYGMLNEELVLGVDVESIRDMGGFMLRLTAYVQHGQASIRDTAWLDLRLALEQIY